MAETLVCPVLEASPLGWSHCLCQQVRRLSTRCQRQQPIGFGPDCRLSKCYRSKALRKRSTGACSRVHVSNSSRKQDGTTHLVSQRESGSSHSHCRY